MRCLRGNIHAVRGGSRRIASMMTIMMTIILPGAHVPSLLRIIAWLVTLFAALAHAQDVNVTAPQLLLAHVAGDDIDPAPYLISEKLDGVRAYWDGKTLRFRSGNIVNAPARSEEHTSELQ